MLRIIVLGLATHNFGFLLLPAYGLYVLLGHRRWPGIRAWLLGTGVVLALYLPPNGLAPDIVFVYASLSLSAYAERRNDLVDVDLVDRDLSTVVKGGADQYQARHEVGTAQGHMKCDAGADAVPGKVHGTANSSLDELDRVLREGRRCNG